MIERSANSPRQRKDLRFRCTSCGSPLTDSVVMSRDALAVQPWRHRVSYAISARRAWLPNRGSDLSSQSRVKDDVVDPAARLPEPELMRRLLE